VEASIDLIELARRHLGPEREVYFGPAIPPDKEASVRALHEGYLPGSEPLVVLYDATLLGSAEDGFVMTAERLCWKNVLEHPRHVPWGELDPAGVVTDGSRVRVGGGAGLLVGGELSASTARLILAMVEQHVPAHAGPYRSSGDALPGVFSGGELPVSRLTALGRKHVGEVDQIFYHPSIPAPKLYNARKVHAAHLGRDETVAVLYDDTVFGGARDGFVITPRRLCWKNFAGGVESVEWTALTPEQVSANGNLLHVQSFTVQLTLGDQMAAKAARLVAAIAGEARGDRGS
jgi:hypothetical protein